MNSIDDQLRKLGYSDSFHQDGDRWGFLNNGVMPQPIPQEIINAIEEQDKRDQVEDTTCYHCDFPAEGPGKPLCPNCWEEFCNQEFDRLMERELDTIASTHGG